MRDHQKDPDSSAKPRSVNQGYATFQIAKALVTVEEHDDVATVERAREKISKWEAILRNILTGSVDYGSRTPVEGVPAWATLEVATGGFTTGDLLASGPLQEHEMKLLEEIPGTREGEERLVLNTYFLSDSGILELQDRLRTGCYDVGIPEEGALMIVAWLVQSGYAEDARVLLEKLRPYFSRLRFYPIPLRQPRRFGSRVHLQDVGKTLEVLEAIKPNKRILAQKEAIEIWAPLYDRIVALFLETVRNDWPCQKYPDGWSDRALALDREYDDLRKKHTYCGKMERANGHSAQLREFLGKCARSPGELTGREVGRIRLILNRYIEKRGKPYSTTCAELRRRQLEAVSAPTFHEISKVVVLRLQKYPKHDGLDDVSHILDSVSEEDAAHTGVPVRTLIPASIQRKAERCLNESVNVLVERGLITSGETVARVLPQMTSELLAVGIVDPSLRQLYAAIYRAFRRRRSLLLLNLAKQVQIEELPWVEVVEKFRSDSLSIRELARKALEEVTVLTLTSFPYSIIPNKLLQELRALATSANLDILLVDELAADIFMGKFSSKFVMSAKIAADLLHNSLYTNYYGIDYEIIRRIETAEETNRRNWFWRSKEPRPDKLAQLCASRAGVSLGTWDPTTNGMIIEQQQILTTQNLAALVVGLDLMNTLRSRLDEMAKDCFRWVCKRQQITTDNWHAQLIMLKNTSYAWRQMIFFLSLTPNPDIMGFFQWAEGYLEEQSKEFRERFYPALNGLILAANGARIDISSTRHSDGRQFLGWTDTRHWLLADAQE